MIQRISEVDGHVLQQVFLSIDDHIGILTLHNPPVNAAGGTVQEELIRLCAYINRCDDIWVAILHSDIRTFCVGVDIHRFKQSIDDQTVSETQSRYYDGALALYELRVPLICAVHGHCLGGGLCYPAGADATIAVQGTVFGAPEAKLSVVGGSGHLARILPPQIQRDLCYRGAFVDAETLQRYGGVTEVVETLADLMPAALSRARAYCEQGPLVLRYLKACMNAQEDFQMKRKNDLEVEYTGYMAAHRDFNEGVTAFLEKRKPRYTGS